LPRPIRSMSRMPVDKPHDFGRDAAERRQYRRMVVRFPLWWMKDAKANVAVAGIGLEISCGGLQFLLPEKIATGGCPVLFTLKERRMLANIEIKMAAEVVYEEQPWLHYRAMFFGLRETDFDFIITITEKLASKPLPTFDTLPDKIKFQIINTLVKMKRMSRATKSEVSSLDTHYVGKEALKGGATFLRFNVRSKIESDEGVMLFDTYFLLSEDGTSLMIRE
jgi:hypothetical protein